MTIKQMITKLQALAKEQTETHRRQMARIKNLVKVLETLELEGGQDDN